jgi:hypothetical protein
MASKRPSSRTPMRAPPPPAAWWHTRSTQVILGAAAFTALMTLFGYLKPVFDSGPLPVPSRAELGDLHKDFEGHLTTIDKTLNETLEAAKAANVTAQQAISQTNDYRLDRLLGQKMDLEDRIKKNPNDTSLRTALEHVQLDIASLPMPKR